MLKWDIYLKKGDFIPNFVEQQQKKQSLMKTKFKLLTWNISERRIFSREFKCKDEAIEVAQALRYRRVNSHDIIGIFRTRRTGHRWTLNVWTTKIPQKRGYISFYSKKDAIFAIRSIKKYDDTLKINLIKIY
jgi:hypothetical protein